MGSCNPALHIAWHIGGGIRIKEETWSSTHREKCKYFKSTAKRFMIHLIHMVRIGWSVKRSRNWFKDSIREPTTRSASVLHADTMEIDIFGDIHLPWAQSMPTANTWQLALTRLHWPKKTEHDKHDQMNSSIAATLHWNIT